MPKAMSSYTQQEEKWDTEQVVVKANSGLNQLWLKYLSLANFTQAY